MEDARLVLGVDTDPYSDWEVGARGGEDIWVKAETFVDLKTRGERSCEFVYLILSPSLLIISCLPPVDAFLMYCT